MNTVFSRRLGSLAVGVLATLLAPLGAHAQVPCSYEVSAIIQVPECPPFGFPPTIGTGISEPVDGGLPSIVGYYQSCVIGPHRAFLWRGADGQFISLDMLPGTGSSEAYDISADGRRIVGVFDVSGDGLGDLGFLYDGEKFIEIPPPAGGTFSHASAVNLQRQITGTTADGKTIYHKAFLWENAVMTLIEPTFGPKSAGRDINETKSQIVGWMGTGNGIDSHAFAWDGGDVIDLGLAPNTFSTWPRSINNAGEVLLRADFNEDEPTDRIGGTFPLQDGEFTDLGALPGYDVIAGFDLSDQRVAVGMCRAVQSGNGPDVGFIWQNGVMKDLNDLIPSDSDLLINWATAVTNAGQITGRATSSTGVVAFLLTPIQPPLGDLDSDCAVGISDLLILLSNWGPSPPNVACPADLDGDGTVGILDLLTLLANWGQ